MKQGMNRPFLMISVGLLCAFGLRGAAAQEGGGAAELAAKLQDPLATIAAIETDNIFSLRAGEDNKENFTFQIQPAYSINFPDWGFSVIPRANIPIIGLKPGTELRVVTDFDDGGGEDVEADDKDRQWGLSDIVTQFFVAPMGQGEWKAGLGPQISWRTRTDNDVKGAGAGAGPSGVLVGGIGQLSVAVLAGHLWGFDGDFSSTNIQPALYYNLESTPGAYVYYNNTISYDFKTKGGNGNSWTVPLGIGIGRTFAVGEEGHGFDIGVGGYHQPTWGRPSGGEEFQIQLKMAWIFPR